MTESVFRHSYSAVRDELVLRLLEPPRGIAQLLSGPRQVGKTTLLLEIERMWPDRALYAAADTPAAALPGWWENVWARAERSGESQTTLLLLDEVQRLPDWSQLLKAKVDEVKRRRLPIQVVASGSSALDLGHGSRETMAGRFERLRLLHWQAAEMAQCFNKDPDAAALDLVRFGGYPGAVDLQTDLDRWRDYILHSIIEPAIGRDILAIESVRRPALLRQVFAVAAGHPAQVVAVKKLQGQLRDPGALETIAHYLELLEEALLVAAVRKHSGKVVRQRAAPPKLVALNNALLSAGLDDEPPTQELNPERWGRWLENACMGAAWNAGQSIYYWRQEPLEVDLVTTGSWGRWAVEVKTGRLSLRSFAGVLEFCRRNPGFRPAVVCDPGQESIGEEAGVRSITWPMYLNEGLVSD
ncbi:MAG: ATP-binding protein [Anaerolineae bacterium]